MRIMFTCSRMLLSFWVLMCHHTTMLLLPWSNNNVLYNFLLGFPWFLTLDNYVPRCSLHQSPLNFLVSTGTKTQDIQSRTSNISSPNLLLWLPALPPTTSVWCLKPDTGISPLINHEFLLNLSHKSFEATWFPLSPCFHPGLINHHLLFLLSA